MFELLKKGKANAKESLEAGGSLFETGAQKETAKKFAVGHYQHCATAN